MKMLTSSVVAVAFTLSLLTMPVQAAEEKADDQVTVSKSDNQDDVKANKDKPKKTKKDKDEDED